MQDIRRMQLGYLVDFVVDYNERQKQADEKAERQKNMKHYRLASKEEVSAWTRG